MENLRKKCIASLMMNMAIIFFTVVSEIESFRLDVVRDEMWFGFTGIHSFRFFTVLSNVFVAVVAVLLIVHNIKNIVHDTYEYPEWLITLKHTATTAVTITFLTVLLFLAPSFAIAGKGYFTLFLGTHIYMHLLNPVLAVLSYVFFESRHNITLKKSLYALLPVAIYAVIYTTMVVFVGEANGGWPDFYNFTFGVHNWAVPISAIGMHLVTFIISLVLSKWHNKYSSQEAHPTEE